MKVGFIFLFFYFYVNNFIYEITFTFNLTFLVNLTNNDKYDVTIIGAGLGGLLTAALLSKEGFKVLVLEKNKQIGGALQSFGIDKKLFESAVHYMGSLSEGQTLYKIFNHLGVLPQLSLRKLDEDCFDEIIIADKHYKLAQGYEVFIDQLHAYFPSSKANIESYCREVKRMCDHFSLYSLRLGSLEEKQKVIGDGYWETLSNLVENEELKNVLSGNNLLYAGTKYKTPFFLHALIQNSYIEGSWKFDAGSAQLAKLLQNCIVSNGGSVLRNIEVVSMMDKQGEIECVTDKDGNKYFSKSFVSNLHPLHTYNLIDSSLIKPITRRRILNVPHTKSCFMVNVSLKPRQIPYLNHNIYFHTISDVWYDVENIVGAKPKSITLFSYEDKLNPGFASAISILGFMDYDTVLEWQGSYRTTSFNDSRCEKYEEWKGKVSEHYIDLASQKIVGLKQAISYVDACSPLTYRDYLSSPNGSIYGVRKDVGDLVNTTFATRTKFKNLFFTGQNINIHGVLGVAITALLTAGEFINLEDLLIKINKRAD